MVGCLGLKCPTLFRFVDSGRQNYSCTNRLSGLFCGWGLSSDVEVQKILLNPAEYIECSKFSKLFSREHFFTVELAEGSEGSILLTAS